MSDVYEVMRSSWGVIALGPHLLLLAMCAVAVGLSVPRASWARAKDERGYGLVEVAFALLIVIVALAVLLHFL
jgi:hypothetical protein